MSLVGPSIGNRTDEPVPPEILAKLAALKARLADMAAQKIRERSDHNHRIARPVASAQQPGSSLSGRHQQNPGPSMSEPSIEFSGRASRIRYTQGSRSIDIDSELLMGTPMLVVYASSMKAWADGQAVTSDESAEIVYNLRRLLRPEWGEIDIA